MYQIIISMFVLNLFLVWTVSVNGIRISPKLDFGDSKVAGFRSDTTREKSNYQINPTKVENFEVVCISGNCTATKSTTENTNGISADVLVHIKTNVDLPKIKNETVHPQSVPDVPIVVGTKSTTISTVGIYNNNRPFSGSNPVYPNYPQGDLLPPVTTNNAFIPVRRPDFVQNPHLYTDSQVQGYPAGPHYAPRFQGADNDIGVPSTYVTPPFNNNVNINNRPIAYGPLNYPKGVRTGNYNPVEFRKTYNTNWAAVKWARNDPVNSDRRTGSGIPRWTPCLCQNPELHQYQTTPTYPSHNHPSGINGKLTPLV